MIYTPDTKVVHKESKTFNEAEKNIINKKRKSIERKRRLDSLQTYINVYNSYKEK